MFQDNVRFLKTDPKARYQGYAFFFKEGFCWSDINTTFLKCRIKAKSINDVKSMSLYGLCQFVPEYYIVSLINSTFISHYIDDFVNNTQTFQINDARQIPIIVPIKEQLEDFHTLFDTAVALKKSTDADTNTRLQELEKQLDLLVYKLYSL